MTTAATQPQRPTTEATLCVAVALRAQTWKLGCTTGHGQQPRERTGTARHQERVLDEIAHATRRVGWAETAPVVSGDAAGREGCWRHRFVQAHGITHPVVDASALEVKRRQRRAKSEGGDVRTWRRMGMRSAQGERHGWQVVKVPAVEAAEHRPRHRDVATLQQERASTTTRLPG
jgi:transposase